MKNVIDGFNGEVVSSIIISEEDCYTITINFESGNHVNIIVNNESEYTSIEGRTEFNE